MTKSWRNDATIPAASMFLSLHLGTMEEAKEPEQVKDDEQEDIIRNGKRALTMLKIAAVILLIIAALVVSSVTYTLVRDEEADDFRVEFIDHSAMIIDQFLEESTLKFWSCFCLSVAYTTEFENSASWPNATLPQFQIRISGLTALARSALIAFAPVVANVDREAWELYAVENENLLWGQDSGRYLVDVDAINSYRDHRMKHEMRQLQSQREVADGIYRLEEGIGIDDPGPGPYVPVWQIHPPTQENKDSVMYNQLSDTYRAQALFAMLEARGPSMSQVFKPDTEETTAALYYPVFDGFDEEVANVVGTTSVEFMWEDTFRGAVPADTKGIVCVLENSHGQEYSYVIEGDAVKYLGEGDLHDTRFDGYEEGTTENDFLQIYQADLNSLLDADGYVAEEAGSNRRRTQEDLCLYTIRLYPTQEFKNVYMTSRPVIYSVSAAMIFVFTSAVFIIYDWLARRRQSVVVDTLARSSKIVRSLFPASVRDRMLSDPIQHSQARHKRFIDGLYRETTKNRLVSFLKGPREPEESYAKIESDRLLSAKSEPIADFFPHTTVSFADIAGFTAWSSDREPSEVFQLLEAVWALFDGVAKRLGVFKVETVGDCYVCVTGLPEPSKEHAVVMTRFAYECLHQMKELLQRLEVSLGPGTSDLAMRFGLHSGPVTAGVLRGEKARFQLFGDTMNTAARMESTGQKNRIHISQATAALLVEAGKEHWFFPRERPVTAKGKGEMQTYWIKQRRMSNESEKDGLGQTNLMMDTVERYVTKKTMPTEYEAQKPNSKTEAIGRWISKAGYTDSIENPLSASRNSRLVDWNVDVLLGLLEKIVKKRAIDAPVYLGRNNVEEVEGSPTKSSQVRALRLRIDEKVKLELHDFVTRISLLCRDVPFHNFEHASHVAMTANNLMKRILDRNKENARKTTFGISSDPLSHFAVVFSSLVHDAAEQKTKANSNVDKERTGPKHEMTDGVSDVASVELAWEMLIEPRYKNLRSCIYADAYERDRFRQFLINCVKATDVTDMELRALRKKRWHAAFKASSPTTLTPEEVNSRKATIVIELIMQTSSAAHYAQHWMVYRKWNERLFTEMYQEYRKGHSTRDPSMGWFENEILFFDTHVIPLSKMIKVCGVFAGSNEEMLTYALQNRKEWEMKGRSICREMLSHVVETEKGGES